MKSGESSTPKRFLLSINSLFRMKRVKISISMTVLAILYIILFGAQASEIGFLVVGGALGFLSSLLVLLDCLHQRTALSSTFALLFWRSTCDLGLGVRFILTPAFNYYVCQDWSCHESNSDENRCGFPGVVMEFFVMASEMWFLCNSIDLIYSVTNPFSSFQTRIKYYHGFIWSLTFIVCFAPLLYHQIYGFWLVNNSVTDRNICWLKVHKEKVGTPFWVMFFLPQWLVFMFGLSSFTIAYMRLRKGLKHTFLPKMKLLLTNVISMVAQALYWGIFFILFSSAFLMRDSPPNYILNNVLYFTLASKGFSSLFVWFFINDYNLKQFESVDANVALREEVLTFATMGIRSAARDGANASPSREEIVRSPVDSRVGDDNLISLYFFFKVLMGYSEEMRHLETIMSMTRKKALEDHSDSRPTGVEVPLPCSHSIDVDNNDLARTTTIEGKIPALVVGNMIEVMSADARHFAQQRDTISMLETEREENPASSGVVLGSSIVSGLKRSIFSSFLSTSHGVFTGAAWDSVEFTEHYPFQFRRIRLAMGVTDDLFASSFSATIKERLTEGGASGAFFFFSKGETYVAKSCAEEEVNVLRSIVGVYADFIVSNPKSYVCKILGAFTLLIYGNRLHFYIMSNLFSNNLGLSVHEKYDIKGSWVARNAQPPVEGKSYTCSYCEQKFVYKKSRGLNKLLRRLIRSGVSSKGLSRVRNTFEVVNKRHNSRDNDTFSPLGTALEQLENGDQEFEDLGYHCPFTVSGNHEPNIVLKDNDLKLKMRLPFSVAIDLLKQLQADAEFLASLGIMDYSLLLGVHNTEYEVKARNDSANTLGNGAPRLSLFPKSRPISTNKTSSNQQEDISTSKLVDGNRILAGSESIACTSPINIEGLSIEKDRMPSVDAKSCHYSRSTESNESLVTVSSCTGGANHMLKVSKVVGPETYFIGIIDILQKWNWKKKWERLYKVSMKGADPDGVSVLEPDQYKDRFFRKLVDILDIDPTTRDDEPFKC